MPNYAGRGSPSFLEAPKGLADMMASALRGATAQGLGLPGDIESLGRAGINFAGGSVDPHSAIPNTEDVKKWLPPMSPISNTTSESWKPMEEAGQFIPGPSLLSAPSKALSMAKGLRSAPAPAAPTSSLSAAEGLTRRQVLRAGGAAALTAAAPMSAIKALRAPAKFEAPAALTAAERPVVAAASRMTAAGLAKALEKDLAHMGAASEGTISTLNPSVLAEVSKLTHKPEELRHMGRWIDFHPEVSDKLAFDVTDAANLPQMERALDYLKNLSDKQIFDVVKHDPHTSTLPLDWTAHGVNKEILADEMIQIGQRSAPDLSSLSPIRRVGQVYYNALENLSDQGSMSTAKILGASMDRTQKVLDKASYDERFHGTPENFEAHNNGMRKSIENAQKYREFLQKLEASDPAAAARAAARNAEFDVKGW